MKERLIITIGGMLLGGTALLSPDVSGSSASIPTTETPHVLTVPIPTSFRFSLSPRIAYADGTGTPPVGFECQDTEGTVYAPGNVRSIVGKDGICKPPKVVLLP